jgi:hypothetical protein
MLLDVLQFAFSGFWTFVGCWIFLGIVVKGIVGLVVALRGAPVTNVTYSKES